MTDTTLTTPSSSTAGSPYQTRAYAFNALNGVMTNTYVSGAPLTAFNWVKDPAVGAVWAQTGLTGTIPTWQAASTWHANITFRGACRGYFVKEAELRAALLAIKRAPEKMDEPIDPTTGKPGVHSLLTGDHVDELVRKVVDYTRLDGTQISGKVAAFITKVGELKTLLDGGFAQSTTATAAEFYTQAATIAKVDAIFTVAARELHARAKKVYTDNLPPASTSPGDTGP